MRLVSYLLLFPLFGTITCLSNATMKFKDYILLYGLANKQFASEMADILISAYKNSSDSSDSAVSDEVPAFDDNAITKVERLENRTRFYVKAEAQPRVRSSLLSNVKFSISRHGAEAATTAEPLDDYDDLVQDVDDSTTTIKSDMPSVRPPLESYHVTPIISQVNVAPAAQLRELTTPQPGAPLPYFDPPQFIPQYFPMMPTTRLQKRHCSLCRGRNAEFQMRSTASSKCRRCQRMRQGCHCLGEQSHYSFSYSSRPAPVLFPQPRVNDYNVYPQPQDALRLPYQAVPRNDPSPNFRTAKKVTYPYDLDEDALAADIEQTVSMHDGASHHTLSSLLPIKAWTAALTASQT